MNKTIVLLIVGVFFLASAANAYELPEGNLVIIEVDSMGEQLEKKIAEKADLLFTREMKNAVLLGLQGVEGYQTTFKLNVKNVSGRRLESISLIERVPKEIAPTAESLESDYPFIVLENDPIIKFSIGTLEEEQVKSVDYKFRFKDKDKEVVEVAFREMGVPIALIPVSENDCIGISCNDFNPCTSDYCSDGQCVYDSAFEGKECSEGMMCVQGNCQKFKSPDLLFGAGIIIITIMLLSIVLIYKSRRKRNNVANKKN